MDIDGKITDEDSFHLNKLAMLWYSLSIVAILSLEYQAEPSRRCWALSFVLPAGLEENSMTPALKSRQDLKTFLSSSLLMCRF